MRRAGSKCTGGFARERSLSGGPPVNAIPDASTFAAVIAEPRFWLAAAITALAGAVRGFSGFGSALIHIPLISAVYSPQVAAASFVIIDFLTGLYFAPKVYRQASWREILPLAASSILAAQFGALILIYADPVALRWMICGLIGAVLAILISGWRYHGRPRLPITIAVGLIAGLLGGAVQIAGPPVIIYWLGAALAAQVVRANFIVYFAIFSAASLITYALRGLLTPEIVALSLMIGPLQVGAMALGTQLFLRASEHDYRRIAYVIVALAAIVSMPLWDGMFR